MALQDHHGLFGLHDMASCVKPRQSGECQLHQAASDPTVQHESCTDIQPTEPQRIQVQCVLIKVEYIMPYPTSLFIILIPFLDDPQTTQAAEPRFRNADRAQQPGF